MRTIGGLEPIKDISDKLKVIDKDNAPVAQGIEQWFSKPSVGGSNPSRRVIVDKSILLDIGGRYDECTPIFILVSIWSGVIIFFSAVVAPTVFKSLEERRLAYFSEHFSQNTIFLELC